MLCSARKHLFVMPSIAFFFLLLLFLLWPKSGNHPFFCILSLFSLFARRTMLCTFLTDVMLRRALFIQRRKSCVAVFLLNLGLRVL